MTALSAIESSLEPKAKRKSPQGVSTNDLVFSAMAGMNADLFPNILKLYVPWGSVVADTSYGKGVFWSKVDVTRYTLHATDLSMGVDARKLPYADGSLDAVVFDPPYMHSEGGGAHIGHQNFEAYYRNDTRSQVDHGELGLTGHAAVVELYVQAAREALRVLKPRGIYIVKCQDEVYACRQRLTHVELLNAYNAMGFRDEDLFVLLSTRRPGVSVMLKQQHARKVHSYFIVTRKMSAPRAGTRTASSTTHGT